MEYAKDIILNVGYRRVNLVRSKLSDLKGLLRRRKEFLLVVLCVLKKWGINIINIIRKNKLISLSLFLLIVLMAADFILIDNFMKIFATLY